ncbi:hypothetical protein FISHEDRAFT_56360 [Fistulina hepatica ATCC 64428]|uniref:Uncharacterized protein n=1 Tax=Fistulina hepatica ATCC 64428 TaxID=1128425 RepID=A0A0D7AJZ1_9AGAR|nr:hypothetical protein FISHEDRAFT_56360 [Fistulina hepatica ATCC 64428]
MADELERRRAYHHARYHRPNYGFTARPEWQENPDPRWKDRLIWLFAVSALVVGALPGLFITGAQDRHKAAAENLRDARASARLIGEQRRRAIQNRADQILADKSSTQ